VSTPDFSDAISRDRPAHPRLFPDQLRSLVDQNADGLLVVRHDGVIVFANPAAQHLLGRPAKALLGQMFGTPICPGRAAEIDLPLAGGAVRIAEMRVVDTVWDGAPAYIASLRDITEHRSLEEELRRKAHELAEADRRKDEFLAMLAHELRNPLVPILNAVEVLRLAGVSDPLVDRQRLVIARQVRHMKRLLDDLLDVARITRGRVRLTREPVELETVLGEALEICRPAIDEKHQRFSLSLLGEPVWLLADPTRLVQIFTNLLSNAVRFTGEGGEITLTCERHDDRVIARVKDSGIGMAPDLLPRVFDLFVQSERGLDRSEGGLGIGLTLVKALVEQHGGTVAAHSDGPGRGSEFVVTLPVLRDAGIAAGPAPLPVAARRQPVSVLVVDDNVDAAQVLAELLELSGHPVRVAHEGPAAIAEALAFRPEVVLLDIGLPGMDGYEVARRLRQETALEGTRLVAVTGYGQTTDRLRSQAAGFDHHLVKPVDFADVQRLLADGA